jgi:hypothetical protein
VIVEAVVAAVFGVLDAVIGLVPAVTFSFGSTLEDFADIIGSQLGGLDSFLPISEMAPVVVWAFTVYLPFVLVFYTVRWIYSKIPVVGA